MSAGVVDGAHQVHALGRRTHSARQVLFRPALQIFPRPRGVLVGSAWRAKVGASGSAAASRSHRQSGSAAHACAILRAQFAHFRILGSPQAAESVFPACGWWSPGPRWWARPKTAGTGAISKAARGDTAPVSVPAFMSSGRGRLSESRAKSQLVHLAVGRQQRLARPSGRLRHRRLEKLGRRDEAGA